MPALPGHTSEQRTVSIPKQQTTITDQLPSAGEKPLDRESPIQVRCELGPTLQYRISKSAEAIKNVGPREPRKPMGREKITGSVRQLTRLRSVARYGRGSDPG